MTLPGKTHGVPQAALPFMVQVVAWQVLAVMALVLRAQAPTCHQGPCSDKMEPHFRGWIQLCGGRGLYKRSRGPSMRTTTADILGVCAKMTLLERMRCQRYQLLSPHVWLIPLARHPRAGSARLTYRGAAMNAVMDAQRNRKDTPDQSWGGSCAAAR